MRKIQRLAAVGAMAALTVALGACSSSEEPAAAPPAPASEPVTPSPEAMTPSGGVTEISDIAGPACGQVPTEGEGSAQGMVDDPVGTAASNNPLLSTLVTAVTKANLVDTLNSAEELTVFAPINPAFEALPPGTVEELTTAPDVAQPTSQLSQILTTHVVGQRLDAEGLQEAGTAPSLHGSELTIGGTAPDALTVSSGGVTANVVCANVPTANATVFLIDKVMMPAKP
ncbi:MAG: fasciclin domain-containing protein [Pseudonocardiaceae bacterium]